MKIVRTINDQEVEIEITKAEAKQIYKAYIQHKFKKIMLDILYEGQADGEFIYPISEKKLKRVFNEAFRVWKYRFEDDWDEFIEESLYDNFSTNL